MPIIKSHSSGWNWFQGAGVHTTEVKCNDCTCKYHLQLGEEIYYFEDYESASEKWSILTGEPAFVLGKSTW